MECFLSPPHRLKRVFWGGENPLNDTSVGHGYVEGDGGRRGREVRRPIDPFDFVPTITSHNSFL